MNVLQFESIDEIYAVNNRVRERLLGMIADITEADESLPTENGEWTVAKMIEHLAVVENSMIRICAKLLSKAKEKGLSAKGEVAVSPHFISAAAKVNEEGTKLQAPDIVQPKGGQPVSESIAAFTENRKQLESIRSLFDEADASAFTFPHPAFGDLNAFDWLVLIGGHEARHTTQIKKILAKKDAAKA